MQTKHIRYIFFFSLFFSSIVGYKIEAQSFTTVLPKNNVMSADSTINFKWNTVTGYNSYKLEISSSSSFSTFIHIGNTITTNTDSFKFTTFGIYYWRVKAYTPSNDSITSNSNTIELFSPKSIPGIQAWFNPDYGITEVNGKITQWNDFSGLNRTATQSDTSKAPTIIQNSLNGHSNIQFDGINDGLNFIDSININSISLLSCWNGTNTTFSNSTTIISCNSPAEAQYCLVTLGGTSSVYYNCFFGSSVYVNKLKTLDLTPLNQYKVISGFKPSTIAYSGTKILRLGHDLTYSAWKGWIPELLLYNNTLFDTLTTQKLNSYYYNKYSPPVNLGIDINVNYGFCDTLITADASHLVSFLWNTGETTSSIRTKKNGIYWVQAIDIFGFSSRDSIYVSFHTINPISDTIICDKDSAQINLINNSSYSYNWSNGQTTSIFTSKLSGTFSIEVIDSNLCSFRDTFNIIIDSLPSKLWLGNDTAICLSNHIGYQLLDYTPIDGLSNGYKFLWNTGDTSSTTAITSTGNYSLTLKNLRGCTAKDTVFVTLKGIPPSTFFILSADSICTEDTLVFTDLTTGILLDRSWNIGEGAPITDSTFSYVYHSPGTFTIQLTTTSPNGCPKTITKNLKVNPSPTANFSTTPACTGLATLLTNLSTAGLGDSIISHSWNFDDISSGANNISTLQDPEHQFSIAGTYHPQITITTLKQCSASAIQLIDVVSSSTPPTPFTLVSPQNNQLISDSIVTFKWDPSDNGYFYTIQIATDVNFTNIIFQKNRLTTNQYSHRFTYFTQFYWRIIAHNICDNTSSSNTQKFELFSPLQITGIQAWFNPDYGITQVNGKITQWNDISGLNRIAIQTDTSKAPKYSINKLNNHNILEFDGINDGLNIQDSLVINSISILSAWNGNNAVFPSSTSLISCTAPSEGEYCIVTYANTPNIYYNCFFGSSFFVDYYKTLNLNPLSKFKVISGFKPSTITYSNSKILRIGHDLSYTPWKGWIPEVILYNNPSMDSTTLAKLTDYFFAKYAPPVSLGYDIKVAYKLCDTLISAQANHFTNYLWSTGDTTPAIHVTRSGSYWVRTTNIFGQLSSDTVQISFLSHKIIPDTTFCVGNSFQFNWTPLTNYTLSWSNGDNGIFTETEAGSYHFTLTDTLGCTYRDTFNLFVDSLALRMSLGKDTSLCGGNTLHYSLNNYTLNNPQYLWSTGDITPTTIADTTRNYWLQITNSLGCIARDSVLVNIRGKAPIVSFTAPGKCLGESTPFTDLSFSPDQSIINQWQWNFGDGNNSSSQNPTHNYALPGIYPITLTVTTDSNCSNTTTIPTVVYTLPAVNFAPQVGCSNTLIQFTDQTQYTDNYTINQWQWNFGDAQSGSNNQSISQHPNHSFDTSGTYTVKLQATSIVGCTDSTTKTITIRSAPAANFVASNTCEGKTTWFSDSTTTIIWNPIMSRTWIFEDETSSTEVTTSRKYLDYGSYPVTYIVTSLNGCTDTITKNINVYAVPVANFTPNSFCSNEPVILESGSSVESDIITYERWKIGNNRVLFGSPIQLYLDSAANYPVQLISTSQHNCSDTVVKNITVKPIPQSQFTYKYDELSVGYNIQFINNTTGASTFEWYSSNGLFSTDQNPIFDFAYEGTFPILLVSRNDQSCIDSASANVLIVSPVMDISVSNFTITTAGNYQQAHVNLINMSNRNITDLWITLQINDQQIRERWTGMIRPGEIIPYQFNTQIFMPSNENLEYGCIKIASPIFTQETNLDNNQICITLGEEFSVLKLYPNPANEYITLWLSSPYESQANIRILSTKGSEVKTWNNQILQEGINQLKLPLTDLSNGLYIMEVEFNNKTERMKFNIIR